MLRAVAATSTRTFIPKTTTHGAGLLGARLVSNVSGPTLNLRVPFEKATERAVPMDVMHLPYEGLMVAGGGINSLTGKATGASVVTHGPLRRIEGADATTDGQTTRVHISIVESVERLFRQMSATMSGGGSYGMFSGSASYSRSEVSDFNSQSTTILATSSVVNGVEYFNDGRLEDEAVEVARQSPERFRARFGDSYVQGLLRGGFYIAQVSIHSESLDVQKKLSASVSASFQGFGGGSGKFSEEIQAYKRFSDIKITFFQSGGVGGDQSHLGTDFDALSEKINRFPQVVAAHPVTLTALASSYLSLDNFPDTAGAGLDARVQRQRLAEYAKDHGVLLTMRNDLQKVQRNRKLYINPPSQATLRSWQQALSDKQSSLESASRACAESDRECPAIPFELPDGFSMPERVDTAVSPEESEKLGAVWREKEGDWSGTWTRVGNSRLFDAVWLKGSEIEKALLEARITGNVVQILRTHSHGIRDGQPVVRDGDCHYTGLLDGRHVKGTYGCDWGTHLDWSADIS